MQGGTSPHAYIRSRSLRVAVISEAVRPALGRRSVAGVAAAVHRRAVVLRLEDGTVTVSTPSLGAFPDGAVLGAEVDLRGLGIHPGAVVTLDLTGAASWSPRMQRRVLRAVTLAARLAMARAAAGGARVTEGFGPLLAREAGATGATAVLSPYFRRADPAIARVASALEAGDVAGAARAGWDLVGLGPGSTPSGDDVLVGLSAALFATGHPAARPFAAACAAVAVGRTTDVAERLHRHAARGEFCERLHSLMGAILAGDPARLPSAIATALDWGATSGADGLLGVLLGLRAAVPTTAAVGAAAVLRGAA